MIMNCVRRRSHESVKMRTGMMMTLVVMMMVVIHHTSADLSTLLQNTARSLKERPERSALEPPTVTALKPPNRNNKSGGRGLGGISVQGEQGGSRIPPMVASRSPSSSSNSRDYKNRYMHINRPVYQPQAPVATAASGSRSGNAGILTGRRPHSNPHHAVPAPMPHLVNGTTTVSIPRESIWFPPVSYAPPPPRHSYGSSGYAPVSRNYPRRPRIHEETMVPEPSYVDGQLQETNPYHGGGVWGQTEDEPTGGLWGDTRRHPSYSQGHPRGYGLSVMEDSLRTDTFGHRLSEDLSHLSSDYPPHRSNSRRTQVHHPIHSADVPSSSRGSQPQEEDIHIINQNHNRPRNGNRNLNVEGREEPSFPQSSGSGTSSSVRKSGMAPTTYGSIFNADRTHPRKVHPKEEVVTHDELPETRHQGTYDSQGNDTLGTPISASIPSAADEDDRQPLTLYEIWHMKNMSTWDEFVEFLQRKGIKVGQVLSYMNEGATREEMIEFLDRPDLTTTPQQSQVFDDQLSDGDVREITDSAELFIPAPSVPVSTTEKMDDGTLRHSASKSREERKKNRKKNKNKKRGRKNRENQKRRRKNKHQTIPDILFTTVIPPTDLSKNGSMNQLTSPETNVTILETSTTPYSGLPSGLLTQEPPTPTVALLSTTPALTEHSVVTENSTNQPIQSQMQTQTVLLEQTTAASPQNLSSEFDDTAIETTLSEQMTFNESAVLEQPDLSSWPLSVTTPSATPVPITAAPTIKPILSPTITTQKITTPQAAISPALLTTEFTPTTKTTPLPVSMGPRAGSLTLPPSSKPSEVSIISFTVMKVPKYETHEETHFEDITPIRKRQKHRTSHKRERKLHHQRMDSHPSVIPRKIEEDMVIQTPFKRKERKDNYTFPVRGFMIITGIMGALAVFTLVVLISYAIIKCSKQPVVNNYQVSEQKAPTQ